MKIAILSDIHGNLEAFQAVIADMETKQLDKVICLGDLIGYGPDPEEVVSLFQKKGYLSVLGNHEAALQTKKMRDWLNFQAQENSLHTEKLLSPQSITFCCELKKSTMFAEALCVHGFPPDSVVKYSNRVTDDEFISYFENCANHLCFVGHSHELLLVSWENGKLHKESLAEGIYSLSASVKYLINAGSVGQPRDGNNNAKYLIWDTQKKTIEVRFVPYDTHTTIQKIIDRGFPKAYGLRLQ
jgi:predicted phosphodiesterase